MMKDYYNNYRKLHTHPVNIGLHVLGNLITFLFLGWCFSGLWNHAITPIFNVTEITTYMGAALLGLIYGSIRLFKFAFKN